MNNMEEYMENFWLKITNSSKIAQTDIFGLVTTFLSDHMFLILGGMVLIVFFMLLLSKKMTDKSPNKNFSSKTTSKQGQYKKFK